MDKNTKTSRLYNRRRSKPLTAFINERCRSPQLLGESLLVRPINEEIIPIAESLYLCVKGSRCRLTICPTCGKSQAKAAGLKVIRDIVGHNLAATTTVWEDFITGEITADVRIDMNAVSFVTVNGPQCDSTDPEVIKARVDSFRKKLSNVRFRHLDDIAASGQFEFSLSETPILHWHGLIFHPGYSKATLANTLRLSFDQPRAVSVSAWWKQERFKNEAIAKRLAEGAVLLDELNLANTSKYTSKALPDLPHRLGKDNQKIANQGTVDLLARWLIQTLILRDKNYQAALLGDKKYMSDRFTSGVKKIKGSRWSRSELVMANGERKHFKLMDIARKARPNRKGKHLNKVITGYGRNSKAMKEWFESLCDSADLVTSYEIVITDMDVDTAGCDDFYGDGEADWNETDQMAYDPADDTVDNRSGEQIVPNGDMTGDMTGRVTEVGVPTAQLLAFLQESRPALDRLRKRLERLSRSIDRRQRRDSRNQQPQSVSAPTGQNDPRPQADLRPLARIYWNR